MMLVISVSDKSFVLPSPLPQQTLPHLSRSSKIKSTQAVKLSENMETSESVKLPMKYVERCCAGGMIPNGFDSFRNWRRPIVVIIFSRVLCWIKFYE